MLYFFVFYYDNDQLQEKYFTFPNFIEVKRKGIDLLHYYYIILYLLQFTFFSHVISEHFSANFAAW